MLRDLGASVKSLVQVPLLDVSPIQVYVIFSTC